MAQTSDEVGGGRRRERESVVISAWSQWPQPVELPLLNHALEWGRSSRRRVILARVAWYTRAWRVACEKLGVPGWLPSVSTGRGGSVPVGR